MLMSVHNETASAGTTTVLDRPVAGGVYASLFEKINLSPVTHLSDLNVWQDNQAMSDASVDERVTAAMKVLVECLNQSGATVEKLDKTLL
ncbi:type VI secretion protein, partial [Erwinia billingiae]